MLLNATIMLLLVTINNIIHLVAVFLLLSTINYHFPLVTAFPFLAILHAIIIQAHSAWYLNDLLVSRGSILTRFSVLHLHSMKTLPFAMILHWLNYHSFSCCCSCKRKRVFLCSVDWTASPCWDCYLLHELYSYRRFEFFAKSIAPSITARITQCSMITVSKSAVLTVLLAIIDWKDHLDCWM